MDAVNIATENIRLLAIETSCDETAAAVVSGGRQVLSNVVASQIDLHAKYGGVFPEMASRQHILAIYPVVAEALSQAHLDLKELDAIAVTRGPGLAGSLVVGINMAKALALGSGLPLVGVNHLEGHIYSAWLDPNPNSQSKSYTPPILPLVALIVSGGHSLLILMRDHITYERLGGTLDDAAGEAFDKVARMLDLPYPGGPSIEKAALKGSSSTFHFPRARLEGSWNFSFSGLKTAVLREVRSIKGEGRSIPVENLAASFQAAVVDALAEKTFLAAEYFGVRNILIVGGVSANEALRRVFTSQDRYQVFIPPFSFCTDNAAMIAAAGFQRFSRGQSDALDIDALPNWPLA